MFAQRRSSIACDDDWIGQTSPQNLLLRKTHLTE